VLKEVKVNIYNSSKKEFYELKLKITETRQVEYLKNILNMYGRTESPELNNFFTHKKLRTGKL
jgi:hypothetical protein